MTHYWYALRVKPHKERSVYELLQTRSAVVYLPMIHVTPVNPRAARARPYFPGYLFVQTDLSTAGVNAFSWTPGARGLVTFGDVPAIVPDNLIHELRQRIQKIEAQGGLVTPRFRNGERVRIVSGPFTGYEAIFDTHLPASRRVQVLLAFLSQHPQPVKLDAFHIAKAP